MLDLHEETERSAVRPPERHGRGWTLFAARLRGEGTEARRAWRAAYVRRALLADWCFAALAAALGFVVRFGPAAAARPHTAFWIAVAMPFVWVLAMLVGRSYEE